MSEHTKTWPELAIGLFDQLTGKGAEIVYEFDNMEVEEKTLVEPTPHLIAHLPPRAFRVSAVGRWCACSTTTRALRGSPPPVMSHDQWRKGH